MKQRATAQGFTLLELLVVIVIVGVMAGAVSMSVGGNESRQLKDEAQRLIALINIASQEAILNGNEMALQVESEGYQFLIFDDEEQEWLMIEADTLRPRELPENIELSIIIEGQATQPTRIGDPEPSRVWILSSGEMSPFILVIDLLDGPRYEINGDILGGLSLEGPLQ